MRFSDYLALALRSLRRSRLRSGLTIAAIVIGATGITIMLTFVTSVKNFVVSQFVQSGQINQIQVSETPNLTYNPSGNVGGPNSPGQGSTPVLTDALELRIAALPHVTGVAATLSGYQLQQLQYFSLGGHRLTVNNLTGYQTNGVIEPELVAGRDLGPADTGATVLLSQDYADALGFKGSYDKLVGQTIEIHTNNGYTGFGATLPNVLPPQNQCGQGRNPPGVVCGQTSGLPAINIPAVVVGVVSSSYAHQTIFMPLSWAVAISNQAQPQNVRYPQQANGVPCSGVPPPCNPQQNPIGAQPQGPGDVLGGWTTPSTTQFITNQGGYQSFFVSVDKTANIAAAATAIDRLGVSTATGLAALNQKKSKANTIGLILGALGLVALSIAALGVMNTMVMSVLERTREIGVMRALGARRSTIRRLFTFEAAGLGFFGGLFGVAIGYVFVLAAKPVFSRAVSSGSISGANFSVPAWLVIVIIAGTTLIGFVSGLIPARRAARLDPVEALRYE